MPHWQSLHKYSLPCPALLSGVFWLHRGHMLIVWWCSIIKSKGTLETQLCSPPKQHLSTTEMKAVDNGGIPTTALPCGKLTVNTGGCKALPTLWRLSVLGGCHFSGISSVPWTSELLLRSNQVVNTCLACQIHRWLSNPHYGSKAARQGDWPLWYMAIWESTLILVWLGGQFTLLSSWLVKLLWIWTGGGWRVHS